MNIYMKIFAVVMMIMMTTGVMAKANASDDTQKTEVINISLEVSDPDMELTMDERFELQNAISLVSHLCIFNASDEAHVKRQYDAWAMKVNRKVKEFIDRNPRVRHTSSGLVRTATGETTSKTAIDFSTFNPNSLK